mmetsp:Transcript_16973/g.21994  ORF Transcript_16973/g.21994 Transcript_16973/m.21994 type:complete len:579 (-) Transcript_16973:183-1919(-)
MDTVGVVDPCQDQLGGRTTEFISNGASIVENGCDESRGAQPLRAARISEAAKKELNTHFEKNFQKWTSQQLPRRNADKELDEIIERHGLNRNQASRQLLNYKQSDPRLAALTLRGDFDQVKKGIESRVGGIDDFVDLVMNEFEENEFCVMKTVHEVPGEGKAPLEMYKACANAVKVELKKLVVALIDAIAQCSARTENAASRMVTRLTEMRASIREQHKNEFLKCTTITTETKKHYGDHYPGAALFFCCLENATYKILTQALANHGKPQLCAPEPFPPPDFTDDLADLIYYLAGWLVFKVKRIDRKPLDWSEWYKFNRYENETAAKNWNLPTELTRRRADLRGARYKGTTELVEYASVEMFNLTWAFEVVYSKLLTTANTLAYGSELVVKISDVILESKVIADYFKHTFNHDQKKLDINLLSFLVTAYHHMRGRDFVRSLTSHLRATQATENANSHRGRLAAIAIAARAASKDTKNEASTRQLENSSSAASRVTGLEGRTEERTNEDTKIEASTRQLENSSSMYIDESISDELLLACLLEEERKAAANLKEEETSFLSLAREADHDEEEEHVMDLTDY